MGNNNKTSNGKFGFNSENPNFTKSILEEEYYNNELSSVKIAKKYKCSKKYVLDSMKSFGIENRTAGETRKLHYKNGIGHITKKGYKKLTINGKQRGEHIHIWCSLNGFDKVPYKHDIHHIDHNKLNNNPSNLMLMSKSNHMSLHRAQTAWVGS